jgi:RHS repeat-associated protein
MVSANDGTTTVTYEYDGTGRRIERIVGGTAEMEYYSGQQVVETTTPDANGNPQVQYQYLWSLLYEDTPVLRDTFSGGSILAGARIYYASDANHNVTVVTDASGNVLEHYDYGAFGTETTYNATWSQIQTSSSVSNTLLFEGQDLDPVTGLVYSRARWYDPATGGFLSRDPLGFSAGDPNTYRYVGGNPSDATDPTGLCADGNSSGSDNSSSGSSLLTRLGGAMQIFGGALEGLGAVGLAVAPDPTLMTKAGAFGLGFLALDNFQAGFQKLVYGKEAKTFTEQISTSGFQLAGFTDYESETFGKTLDGGLNFAAGFVNPSRGINALVGSSDNLAASAVAGTRPGGNPYWTGALEGSLDLHPVQIGTMTQIGESCGPSAVMAALQQRGIPITAEIAENLSQAMAANSNTGTRFDQLYSILQDAGANVQTPKLASIQELQNFVGNPLSGNSAIAQIFSETSTGGHFVFVEGFTQRNGASVVQILDSNEGARFFVSKSEFASRFQFGGNRGPTLFIGK